ncbi:MAG: PQQ-like beta-propeller repeat protein [Thermoguttaceae bacterium]|nr:PQQ-like beta-propeller repeat protein [Thermoguttaceae bacterium]MDW8078517.1 PQQ-binding-like beta-propeller repeat protein [Thermoguttaceae bacterium]
MRHCWRMTRLSTAAFAVWMVGCCLLTGVAFAQDWPQWRGPNRDGYIVGLTLPESWPASWRPVWRIEVGEGYSSPVLVGDRLYVFAREDEQEVLRAVSLVDGKVLWVQKYPAPYEVNPAARAHGKGPKSTPVVGGNKIVTLGISGILSCWSTEDGKLLWQHRFEDRFGETSPDFGTAMSPMVLDGQRVLAFVGGPEKGAFCAWDLASGKELWQWAGDPPAYSSPVLATLGGREQVVIQSRRFCSGLDPQTGELLWQVPFVTQYNVNIVTPVVWNDLLIVSGFRRGTTAYRIVPQGGKLAAQEVWHNKEVSMYMNSPVVVGDRLIGLAQEQRGQFFALDAASGKVLWRSEPKQGENAALLVLGKYVLALTTGSELIVLDPAADSFKPIVRWKVAETPTWAHPVWSKAGLVVKEFRHLALLAPESRSAN